MLTNTARGLPRFSITSDRPSSSPRRRSLPKLARASIAVTTIPSFITLQFNCLNCTVRRKGVNNRLDSQPVVMRHASAVTRAVSGNLFEPFHQIELGKQASIAVNVGSSVRAEINVRDVMKPRYVWWSYFSEKLPLSGQNVQAIDLDR